MAKVTISEVEPLQPECLFTDPFKFKIRFNCIEDLQDDLDWKIIYVGSANSNQHDQGNDFIPVEELKWGASSLWSSSLYVQTKSSTGRRYPL